MTTASRLLAAWVVACGFVLADPAAASRPSMNECFEASDFISNAALSRDGGMSPEAFLGRMEDDFIAIRAFPNDLRWFAHDPDEFWAVTGDTAGPLASLLADLSAAERAQVKREVTEGIAKFRAGDVYRIPAQAQLAWGRA